VGLVWRGDWEWETGRKGGMGGVWEVGIEGQEAGFPRWWKALEIGGNYATLCNILLSK